jgi:site-specific DNA-methyltransferase (adenine-specific)
MRLILNQRVEESILAVDEVDLWLTDPPYGNVLAEKWDRWKTTEAFVEWWLGIANIMFERTAEHGSLVFFAGLGAKTQHAVDLVVAMRKTGWTFRNWITWSKRRAIGKSHDYLNAREEILWFSKSKERTGVTFNKPFTDELSDFKKVFSGKPNPNAFKRATTVWKDIPESLRAKASGHSCEKPERLIERLLLTHSDVDDLIVDPFCGSGVVAACADKHGRQFMVADADKRWTDYTAQRTGTRTVESLQRDPAS